MNDEFKLKKEIKEYKLRVDTLKCLGNLEKNKDFQKLFLDYYSKEHVFNLVKIKADEQYQTEQAQRDIDNQLMSVSFFIQFIEKIRENGLMAKELLQESEHELDLINREN